MSIRNIENKPANSIQSVSQDGDLNAKFFSEQKVESSSDKKPVVKEKVGWIDGIIGRKIISSIRKEIESNIDAAKTSEEKQKYQTVLNEFNEIEEAIDPEGRGRFIGFALLGKTLNSDFDIINNLAQKFIGEQSYVAGWFAKWVGWPIAKLTLKSFTNEWASQGYALAPSELKKVQDIVAKYSSTEANGTLSDMLSSELPKPINGFAAGLFDELNDKFGVDGHPNNVMLMMFSGLIKSIGWSNFKELLSKEGTRLFEAVKGDKDSRAYLQKMIDGINDSTKNNKGTDKLHINLDDFSDKDLQDMLKFGSDLAQSILGPLVVDNPNYQISKNEYGEATQKVEEVLTDQSRKLFKNLKDMVQDMDVSWPKRKIYDWVLNIIEKENLQDKTIVILGDVFKLLGSNTLEGSANRTVNMILSNFNSYVGKSIFDQMDANLAGGKEFESLMNEYRTTYENFKKEKHPEHKAIYEAQLNLSRDLIERFMNGLPKNSTTGQIKERIGYFLQDPTAKMYKDLPSEMLKFSISSKLFDNLDGFDVQIASANDMLKSLKEKLSQTTDVNQKKVIKAEIKLLKLHVGAWQSMVMFSRYGTVFKGAVANYISSVEKDHGDISDFSKGIVGFLGALVQKGVLSDDQLMDDAHINTSGAKNLANTIAKFLEDNGGTEDFITMAEHLKDHTVSTVFKALFGFIAHKKPDWVDHGEKFSSETQGHFIGHGPLIPPKKKKFDV